MRKIIGCLATCVALVCIVLVSCSPDIAALPDKPASVDHVKRIASGKKFATTKTGFYGSLTINDKTEIEWIDAKIEKDKTTIESAQDELKFSVHFLNDSAATVVTKDSTYAAKYVVDDNAEEEAGKEGVKLRLTYKDPSFSFGGMLSDVTYTFVVKGIDDKRLLLQLPRSINRKPLVSMLESQ
jgi:hypothetical protein